MNCSVGTHVCAHTRLHTCTCACWGWVPSAAAGSSFPESPIWSVGQCLMVHLLCFKYLLFGKSQLKKMEENMLISSGWFA